MLRRWDNLTPVPIPGTEGALGFHDVSPSGDEVAFVTNDFQLKVVSLAAGIVRSVATGVSCCIGWGTEGFIYYTPIGQQDIARVPESGGASESIVAAWDTRSVRLGFFRALPGQRGIVVAWRQNTVRPLPGDLWAVEPSTGEAHVITPGIGGYVTPTGHLVFASTDGQIFAAPFDSDAAELTGAAVPVIDNLFVPQNSFALFSLSESGTLVYWTGNTGAATDELFWVTRSGGVQEVVGEPFTRGRGLEISPDGRHVAYGRNSGSQDIWVQELPDGAASRLTLSEAAEYYPHWAPDGRSVTYATFSVQPGATTRMLSQAADGTGAPVVLTEGEVTTTENFVEGVWAADGEALILRRLGAQAGLPASAMDLYLLRPAEGGPATPLIATADFAEQTPSVSRDGRWLAYTSNETGRPEVFVRPFPDVNAGKWQVSTGGGSHPVWAHNGRELFFYDQGSGELKYAAYVTTAATATTAPSFRRTEITTLFSVPEGAYSLGTFWSFYDVAPDDERFLMIRPVGATIQRTAVVVKNFFEELRSLAPN
jgi:serine/threonine-protein kinase